MNSEFRASQAHVHSTLVRVCERQGRPDEAHAHQVLEKSGAAETGEGPVRALNAVGWCDADQVRTTLVSLDQSPQPSRTQG